MLILLFCFSVIIFLSISFGGMALKLFDTKQRTKYSLIDHFFIGICFIGTILNFISVFSPITFYTLIFISVPSVIFFYKHKSFFIGKFQIYNFKWFKRNKKTVGLIVGLLILTLLVSVLVPQNYDSYLYHINAIQWIENYKVVPGLANLHDRFGLNSSVFTLSACFSFYELYNQYIFPVNSCVYFVFGIWIFKSIFNISKSKGLLLFVFFFYFTKQYLSDISSPGTDLLPNIFVAFLMLQIIVDVKSISEKQILFVVVSLFCFTLKISTAPLLLLSFIALINRDISIFQKVKSFLIISFILVSPWLIRNVILTGYLIFPMEHLDIFEFDWKIKVEKVISIREWITSWARIPFESKTEVLNLSYTEWIPKWWKLQTTTNKFLLISACLSPLVIFILTNLKLFFFKSKSLLLVFFISIFGFVFWFFTAPDFRFSFSFILLLSVLPLLLLEPLFKKYVLIFKNVFQILVFLGFFILIQESYQKFKTEYRSLSNTNKFIYLQNDVYNVKFKKRIIFNSVLIPNKKMEYHTIYYPAIERSQCFDQFPCTWFYQDDFELRGDSFQDGFKAK
ncbi:LIC_10190 family membrane protein [Flavobacterium filum]|uniref:LIC_10190 family membrane protein n=1 Tax=Flavobacterium filum TaxID=370974 RepID=UPI000409392A|nr:hypothetical protein [Flavobacterium filum]